MNTKTILIAVLSLTAVAAFGQGNSEKSVPVPAQKRYPWDSRALKCFMSPEALQLPMCKAQKDWPNFYESTQRFMSVLATEDIELIQRATEELGLVSTQFDSGRYYLEAWSLAVELHFAGTAEKYEPLLKAWEAVPGAAGIVSIPRAQTMHTAAWRARGGGYSKSVSPEAWELYYENLAAADVILEAAPDKIKTWGPWYVAKLRLAYELPKLRSSIAQILRLATKDTPDLISIYGIAMHFATPKWGGSFKDMESVAHIAVEQSKKKWGSSLYSILYASTVVRDQTLSIKETQVDWEMMKKGIQDLEDRRGGEDEIWGDFVSMACQMRDREETRRLYGIIDKKFKVSESDAAKEPCRRFAMGGVGL